MQTRRGVVAGLAGGAVLGPAPLLAQAAPPKPVPAFKLPGLTERREEAALLARIYRTLHPGLMRYHTASSLASSEAWLTAGFAAATTADDLWLAASRYTARVQCGHSYVSPFNQGRVLRAAVVDRRDRLPFLFRWRQGRMIVTRALVDQPGLVPGTEILAVDGESARAMLARMLPLARADGGNDAKRIADLEVRGGSRWDAFDVLRRLTLAPATMARVRMRPPAGQTVTLDLPLIDSTSRATPDLAPDAPAFTRAMQGKRMVITMPGWALYDSKWDWQGFIDTSIDMAIDAGADTIIADLRGNEGGLDCGDAIIARMVAAPVSPPAQARKLRYRTTPADLDPMLDTWDDSFRRLGVDAMGPDAQGFYTQPPRASRVIAPRGRRFTGRLVTLVDNACSSATFQFAQFARELNLGPIVGEPTGGNRRGINGSNFFFVRLPHSRLEADLPLIGLFPATPQPNAGLIPDVLAPVTAASIADGSDPGMVAALRV